MKIAIISDIHGPQTGSNHQSNKTGLYKLGKNITTKLLIKLVIKVIKPLENGVRS